MFLLCSQKLYTYTASRQKCQNDPKSVPPGCKRSMMFPPTFGHLFFRTWHHLFAQICNILQQFSSNYLEKTIISLLHVCWPMPICCKGKKKRGEKFQQTHESNKDWVPWGQDFFFGFLASPACAECCVCHTLDHQIHSFSQNKHEH